MQYTDVTTGQAQRKLASTMSDWVGDYAAHAMFPGIGSVGSLIGRVHGLASDPTTEADIAEANDNPGMALIPGVGRSRLVRRWKQQVRDKEGGYTKGYSQVIGPATSTLALTLLGAGVGALSGHIWGKDPETVKDSNGDVVWKPAWYEGKEMRGAEIGAGIGAGAGMLANLLGMFSAAATRRRTAQEHKDYIENGSAVADYLVPGRAEYNYWKTVGRMMAEDDALAEKHRKAMALLEQK